jgi:hypothetical protein
MKSIYIGLAALCLLSLLSLSLIQSPKVYAEAVACQLSVPANPLSAQGLATTWKLQSPCHEFNPDQAVFVQGVIYDKDAHTLSSYSPLVVDEGTDSAIASTAPTLPANSDVALFLGGNDDATILIGDGAASCVNGADGHIFGQVAFCGATQFFKDVNALGVTIPPLGIGNDGKSCPSVRDFRVIDQDQSDNVQTTYLVLPNGQTAQNTAANRAALGTVDVAKNPSDNRLLTNFVDPALGCQPWRIPDIADNGNLVPSQATNELQAAKYQTNPVALIPAGDPMTGPNNLAMVNAYRLGVDQPTIHALGQANTVPYCRHLKNIQPDFLEAHEDLFKAQPSPAADVNLYDFMQNRLAATMSLLGCK